MWIRGHQTQHKDLGSETFHEIGYLSRDSEKVTVWWALSMERMIGTYFFDHPIVTGNSCLALLNNYFHQMLLA